MGKVVPFPQRKIAGTGAAGDDGSRPSCDRCSHFLSGLSGDYCRAIGEDLMTLYEAEECDLYDG